MEKKARNELNKNPVVIVVAVVLVVYALSMIFVLGWGLLSSLKSNLDFNTAQNYIDMPNMKWSEKEFTQLMNYQTVLLKTNLTFEAKYFSGFDLSTKQVHTTEGNYFVYLFNTLAYTLTGSVILAVVPAIGAYMCAKYKFLFSKIQINVYLLFMMIPIIGAYPAELTLLRTLGMYDTLWGNWIQKLHFSGMYFFVYLAFYQGMADAYAEAAEIDGASQFSVLCSIILPLSIKTIGSVWLVQFITLWNDYQVPMLYLPTIPTLAYVTYAFANPVNGMKGLENGIQGNTPVLIAACMLLAMPILGIYIAFNQKMMGNISMGGIKG